MKAYDNIRVLNNFIRDATKRQQAFWRRCRGTAATLSSDSVVLVSFSFSFLLPPPPLPMKQLSFPQLSTLMGEFPEPSPSSTSSYELDPGFIAMVRKSPFSRVINEGPLLSQLKEAFTACPHFEEAAGRW